MAHANAPLLRRDSLWSNMTHHDLEVMHGRAKAAASVAATVIAKAEAEREKGKVHGVSSSRRFHATLNRIVEAHAKVVNIMLVTQHALEHKHNAARRTLSPRRITEPERLTWA